MILLIINILTAFLFIGIAYLITEKNAPHVLSGYHQLSAEEKNEFDLKPFLSFFKNFHLALGVSIIILSLGFYFFGNIDALIFTLVFLPLLAYLFFIFRIKAFYPSSQKKTLNIAFGMLLVALLGVSALLFTGQKSSEIIISDSGINITGMYGEEISYSQISSIQLVYHLPEIKYKTNGYATENVKKGYFKTVQGKKIKLLLNNLESPYILFKLIDDKEIYFSKNKNENKFLFDTILKEMEKQVH